MSLKSKHPPQMRRFTVTPGEMALIVGRYSSTILEMASREAESDLSPVNLQRHSRQTRSNDMAPFANGTAFRAVIERLDNGASEKAELEVTRSERRAKDFMAIEKREWSGAMVDLTRFDSTQHSV